MKTPSVNWRVALTFAVSVVGVVLCAYGAYLVYPAAGFIVAGLSCLVLGRMIDIAYNEREGTR